MNTALWEKAIEFHGHKCKGLALGFRMGEEAKKIFGTSNEIACILPGRNCITDGITGSIGASEEPHPFKTAPINTTANTITANRFFFILYSPFMVYVRYACLSPEFHWYEEAPSDVFLI